MIKAWSDEAWDDYIYWYNQGNKSNIRKINKLIKEIDRTPFTGTGKPEPLKENLTGYWSRRIDDSNRLVYAVEDMEIVIISCRYHYEA